MVKLTSSNKRHKLQNLAELLEGVKMLKLVWLLKPIKLIKLYNPVSLFDYFTIWTKVSCPVKPFKLGVHFVQLNIFSYFDYSDDLNHSIYIVQFLQFHCFRQFDYLTRWTN